MSGRSSPVSLRLFTASALAFALVLMPSIVRAESPTGLYGEWVRAAMDQWGNIHLVYTTGGWNTNNTVYSKFNGSSWSSPVTIDGSGQCNEFTLPDIAVGPDGRAQVVYGVSTGEFPEDLNVYYYAKANDVDGTSWNKQQFGWDGTRHSFLSIAVDESNQPHITQLRTNKDEDAPWWEVVYRRPDGTEKIIRHTDQYAYNCKYPGIAYANGLVHITWFEGGNGPHYTNIFHAADTPYGSFTPEQVTNVPVNKYCGQMDIDIDPNGQYEVAYMRGDWSDQEHGFFDGIYSTRTGEIDATHVYYWEAHEERGPTIAFAPDGTCWIAWGYRGIDYSINETYYVMNAGPRVTLPGWGMIDVVAGSGGSYYVRAAGDPGPIYYEELQGGEPPNQNPVALFTFSPQSGDINTTFQFDASDSYDPDNNLPLTYRWDWNDDGDWDLEQVDVPTASHSYSYPGTYTVILEVQDTRGGKGAIAHDVTVINHDPDASFTATIVGTDSVQFDASASSDVEDGSRLVYRWDWEDDGTYDTGWKLQPDTLKVFSGPGIYAVRLQVRDMLWATGETMLIIENLAPEPPTDLQVMAVEPFAHGWGVTLSWTPSSSEDVISQTVLRAFPQGVWEDLVGLGTSTATYQDTVYQEGVYSYKIACTNGFYTSESDSVTIEAMGAGVASGLPATLTLTDVAPNPTRDACTVRFGVPSPGTVIVTAFDVSGRRASQTASVCGQPGWYSYRWEPRDSQGHLLPAGVYLVRLSMDGTTTAAIPVVVAQ